MERVREMIALDTNILVRYLTRDDAKQFEVARVLLESLTVECRGYICREVIVELVWVLERSYGCSRDQVATILEELITSEDLVVEVSEEVARALPLYRRREAELCDLMIVFAAKRAGADSLYTLDRKFSRIEGVSLLDGHAS